MIAGLITAARQYAEKYSYRAFFNQQWVRVFDHFPYWYCANGTVNPANRSDWPYYAEFWNRITIDVPKLTTLLVDSITYLDQTGTVQTLPAASYQAGIPISQPARISVQIPWAITGPRFLLISPAASRSRLPCRKLRPEVHGSL